MQYMSSAARLPVAIAVWNIWWMLEKGAESVSRAKASYPKTDPSRVEKTG
jgi:hypothetical protein